jgi:hypothetical protein
MLDSIATKQQPAPSGDGIIVLEQVLRRIGPVAYISLVKDLKDRAEMGFKKYGTYLRTNNGRDPQVDTYQELLDAIMYSMQTRLDGSRTAGQFFELLVSLAAQLVYSLEETQCTEKSSTRSAV